MAFKEPKWGFWIPVRDRQSAEYAAKMSGLLVFLMGLNFVFVGSLILNSSDEASEHIIGILMALSGILFLISGVRIRKLKFETLPVTVPLWVIITTLNIFFMNYTQSTP